MFVEKICHSVIRHGAGLSLLCLFRGLELRAFQQETNCIYLTTNSIDVINILMSKQLSEKIFSAYPFEEVIEYHPRKQNAFCINEYILIAVHCLKV